MATYFKGVLLVPPYPESTTHAKRIAINGGYEASDIAPSVYPNLFYGLSMNTSFSSVYIQDILTKLSFGVNTLNNSFIAATSVPTQLFNPSVKKGFFRGKTNILSINMFG